MRRKLGYVVIGGWGCKEQDQKDIALFLEVQAMERGELLRAWISQDNFLLPGTIDIRLSHIIANKILLADTELAGHLHWERPENEKPQKA